MQSRSAQRRPYCLPSRWLGEWRSRYVLLGGGPKGVTEESLDALVVESGPTRLDKPAPKVLAQRTVSGHERSVAQSPRDERPDTRTSSREPGVFELSIGLEDRIGVDRQASNHVLDRGKLIALPQQPQPERRRTCWTICKYGETPERLSRWNSIAFELFI